MYLLFEGLAYDKAQLDNIKLDSRFYTDTETIVVNKCGYCRPSESDSPIFCLPKVFIKQNGKFLGEYEIDGVLDTQSEKFNENSHIKDAIFSLSSWLYAAIRTYQKRMVTAGTATTIIGEYGSQNILSNIGEDDYAQLDVIMALQDFYKKNSNLFIKIAREAHRNLSKVNWQKTVNRSHPFFQNGTPIYMNMRGSRKEINYDEQLLILYFSTLEYISTKLGIFDFQKPIGYNLISPQNIEDNLESGATEKLLLRIKRNYFSDKMRYLWQLLYMFYTQNDSASTEQKESKYLLVHSFQNVFEDMIEYLIGDTELPDKKLKDQKDGHLIDHIFKYQSLIFNEESIFYVGDSKYYKETSDIQEYSEEKQYTYAHNVIKYNMDFFRNPTKGNFTEFIGGTRYRDEITEGYAITPNFFISGIIKDPNDYYNNDFDLRRDKSGKPEHPKCVSYFDDRLFDRDTLFIQHYDINFLYVLSAYVSGNTAENHNFKTELQYKLRNNFIAYFNSVYDFYLVNNPYGGIKSFVDRYFRLLIGKIYRTSDNRLIIALEKEPRDENIRNHIFKVLSGMCNLEKFELT